MSTFETTYGSIQKPKTTKKNSLRNIKQNSPPIGEKWEIKKFIEISNIGVKVNILAKKDIKVNKFFQGAGYNDQTFLQS